MNKILLIFAFFTFLLSCTRNDINDVLPDGSSDTPGGTVDTKQTITSLKLNKEMHYSVYLPPSYNNTTDSYPVLYLLHGMWGNYKDWVINDMASITNLAINEEKAKEMIVVMPDGLDAFYCNNYNGGNILYEDFLIEEFFPHIESNYRVKAKRDGRAIAGLSMGGYGATFHAFKRPEMFCACYSMSGALSMGSSAPDLREIINNLTDEQLDYLPVYTMECGTEDFLVFSSNESFDKFLTGKSISHTYVKRTGLHDWDFWTACLPKALELASSQFE